MHDTCNVTFLRSLAHHGCSHHQIEMPYTVHAWLIQLISDFFISSGGALTVVHSYLSDSQLNVVQCQCNVLYCTVLHCNVM